MHTGVTLFSLNPSKIECVLSFFRLNPFFVTTGNIFPIVSLDIDSYFALILEFLLYFNCFFASGSIYIFIYM